MDSPAWKRFNEIMRLHVQLGRAVKLMSWDEQTYMPKGAVETRAETQAEIKRHMHELITSDAFGEILSRLEEETAGMPYESDPASLVRIARRAYERDRKLPSRLVAELTKAESLGVSAWERARAADDFPSFAPYLERLVDLQIEKADALGYDEDRYDALLDLYEPEMKSAQVAELFESLKGELIPLVRAIGERPDAVDDAVVRQAFPPEEQFAFTLEVIEALGFDLQRGRQDHSAHPFTMNIAPADVRLTTRVYPDDLTGALYSSIHEAGHGMYEQGLPDALRNTFLCDSISLGIHESQSRLWENVVGRSRHFWRHFLPRLQERFPAQTAGADVETVYRAVNKVQPSLIRVEADEVTYNLHVLLRFELERDLVHRRLHVRDLPEAWNAKMEQYLGIRPPSDALGVLQDIHWSAGLFGYFPTYSLGTVLSVQLYEAARRDLPDLEERMAQGEFHLLRDWMHERIYRHGARFTPLELIQRELGTGLEPGPYLSYIRDKYEELYALK